MIRISPKVILSIVLMAFPVLGTTLLTGCASTPRQEGTGEFVDNSLITTKIKTKFLADPDIKSLNISVYSFKGRVELSGYVDSAYQKHKAVDIARNVEGVKSVIDGLVVRHYHR